MLTAFSFHGIEYTVDYRYGLVHLYAGVHADDKMLPDRMLYMSKVIPNETEVTTCLIYLKTMEKKWDKQI